MLNLTTTTAWHTAFPGASIGLLEISNVENATPSPLLDQRKLEVEARLRNTYAGFSRQELLALPIMAAYDRYYKPFNKTYHVQLQVESLIKGKSLPQVSPLVDANFAAEVETFILTAGHDVDKLLAPVSIDVSSAEDEMALMNGTTRLIRAGDMVMRDAAGVSCSIIYGQDKRSPITPETQHVLYVCYAPRGVTHEQVEAQLKAIEQNVRLAAPDAKVEQSCLLTA